MALYELNPNDIKDLRELISTASLTITANGAKRVAYLQTLLETVQPSNIVETMSAELALLEKQVSGAMSARDAALLEAGLARGREAAALDKANPCECQHSYAEHDNSGGICLDDNCPCSKFRRAAQ